MTTNRLILTALSLGVLVGLLAIAQGMMTNTSEQKEAMPATEAFNSKQYPERKATIHPANLIKQH